MTVYTITKREGWDVSFDVPRLDLREVQTLCINGILWRRVVSTGLASVWKSFSMLDSLDVDGAASDSPHVGGEIHRH